MTAVIETSLRNLEWPDLLAHVAALAQTELGAGKARAISRGLSEEAVRASLARIEEARAALRQNLPPDLAAARATDAELARAAKGASLEGYELWKIASNERLALEVQKALSRSPIALPLLQREAAALDTSEDMVRRLSRTVDAEGALLDTASPALAALRHDLRAQAEGIRSRIESILHSSEYVPFLQDDFFTLRENRYVIPLKTGAQAQIEGIVHDTSNTGATVFLEPKEIIEANNRLKMTQRAVAEEEERIRRELSDLIRGRIPVIEANSRYLVDFDLLLAKARLAERLGANPPALSKGGEIHLNGLVHPLLRLQGGRPVPNSLALAADVRSLILSGPNGGGKTVLLKALGLSALMLGAGMPIPAQPGSSLPLFTEVLADIGDAQSLSAHLSSFTGHLYLTGEMLKAAGPKSLVLFDELMSGTAPDEGAALARSLVEYLEKRAALVAVTTHYEPVKQLAAGGKGRMGLSMGFDPKSLRPTFQATTGTGGRSLAFEAAQDAKLPEGVIEGARSLLSPERRRELSLQSQLEGELETLEAEKEKAALEAKHAREARAEYEERLEKLEKRERKELSSELAGLREDLSKARFELRSLRRRARSEGSREAAGALERLAGHAEALAARAAQPGEEAPGAGPLDWTQAKPGDPVLVDGSGRKGILVELPDAKGRARIEMGNSRMLVEAAKLRRPSQTKEKQKKPAVQAVPIAVQAQEAASNRLDLRGRRGDDAVMELAKFLDHATLAGLEEVTVIHGHGEGILKRLIREQLETSDYVASSRPGNLDEGGDGVTVIKLR